MKGMKTGRLLLAVLLALPMLAASSASGEESGDFRFNPHGHFRDTGTCRRCHVYAKSVMESGRFLPEADAFCLGCHSIEGLGESHPRGVRPGGKSFQMEVPKDFPLDSDGKMLCLTCHTAHGPFLSPTRAFAAQKAAAPEDSRGGTPAYRTYFARRSDPVRGFSVLCEECHGRR